MSGQGAHASSLGRGCLPLALRLERERDGSKQSGRDHPVGTGPPAIAEGSDPGRGSVLHVASGCTSPVPLRRLRGAHPCPGTVSPIVDAGLAALTSAHGCWRVTKSQCVRPGPSSKPGFGTCCAIRDVSTHGLIQPQLLMLRVDPTLNIVGTFSEVVTEQAQGCHCC